MNKHLSRFAFIETKLLWDEGLTVGNIASVFSISRQAAQVVLNQYRKLYPGQMTYDRNLKLHIATQSFQPEFVKKDAKCFLDYLRGQSISSFYKEEEVWSDIEVTDINRSLQPPVDTVITKILFTALKRKKTVQIQYLKKKNVSEDTMLRIISPNHLVFANNRYHIRAYCHFKEIYLDFVLSNIILAEFADDEWISSREDVEWNTFVSVKLSPNPELLKDTQNALLKRFEIEKKGIREIRCRKALAYYVEKSPLLIDPQNNKFLWVPVD